MIEKYWKEERVIRTAKYNHTIFVCEECGHKYQVFSKLQSFNHWFSCNLSRKLSRKIKQHTETTDAVVMSGVNKNIREAKLK